jgi:hypothetical protein
MRVLILSPSFYSAAVKAKEFDSFAANAIIATDSVEAITSLFEFKNPIVQTNIYDPQSIVNSLGQPIDLIVWCSDKFAMIAAEIYRLLGMDSRHVLPTRDAKLITDKFHFDEYIASGLIGKQRKLCPKTEQDFIDNLVAFDFPIFVKPNRSSGTYTTKPWGYKKYDSLADFYGYLNKSGFLKDFLKHNREAGDHLYSYGEYAIYEFVPNEAEIFYVNLLKVDNKVFFLPNGEIIMSRDEPDVIDQIYFSNADYQDERHKKLIDQLSEKISSLRGTFFLGIQLFDLGDRFLAFDVNTRLSTVWFEFQREYFPSFFSFAFSIMEDSSKGLDELKKMTVQCVGFKKLYEEHGLLPEGVKLLKLDRPQSSQIYQQPLAIAPGSSISQVKSLLGTINKIEEN